MYKNHFTGIVLSSSAVKKKGLKRFPYIQTNKFNK